MRSKTKGWLGPVLCAVVCVGAMTAAASAGPQQGNALRAPSDSVRYTISLAGYRDHLLHIRCDLPPGEERRVIQLPVWNALYQVRDFAQYVNRISAQDASGRLLPIQQLDTSTWQIEGAANGAAVEYDVFADQPGPYGAQVNDHHVFLNLAEVLVYSAAVRASPAQVRLAELPAGWKVATAMEVSAEWFEAANYDQLVDSPIEAGTFWETDFDDAGARYRVVVDADPADYDLEHIAGALHKIVDAATSWMNDRPYSSYLFVYHFPHGPGGGGMEHAYSTAIELNSQMLRDEPATLVGVSAHEFFHLWNVKRIRPQSLEPIDYSKENYTTALWFSEGVTSTVEDILLLRAGLLDEPHYLQRLGEQITQLERRPAHLTQSAEQSSLDAWLEKYSYYRQAERSISYYDKGELLGVMLDLAMRENSHGRVCLRDMMQWMNENYARRHRFFPDSAGVERAAEAVGGGDLSAFFQKYVAGTEEIPWDSLLNTVGLRALRKVQAVADPGFAAARNFDAPPAVSRVQHNSDAERAGLAPGDVILEMNGRVASSDFQNRLDALAPGDLLKLTIRNVRGDHKIQWRLGSREQVEFQVTDVENISAPQSSRRAAWLKGESQAAGDARP